MLLPEQYEFHCPLKTISGLRALDNLPVELDGLNSKKPLILCTQDVGNVFKQVVNAFKDSDLTIGVCDQLPTKADLATIRQLAVLYREKDCDAIVAVGGADTAKGVNIMVSEQIDDFKDFSKSKPLKPFVLVAASLQTGWEVSKYAQIEDLRLESHLLMPQLAVIDPRMLINTEAEPIAAAAWTTMTYAAEAAVNLENNPLTYSYAASAISFIQSGLVSVIENLKQSKARLELANAAVMAGCASSNAKLGLVQNLGRYFGTKTGKEPGLFMGVMLPYILEYQSSINQINAARLLLPLGGIDDYARCPENKRARMALDLLYVIQDQIYDINDELATTLSGLGLAKKYLAEAAKEYEPGCLKALEAAWERKALNLVK